MLSSVEEIQQDSIESTGRCGISDQCQVGRRRLISHNRWRVNWKLIHLRSLSEIIHLWDCLRGADQEVKPQSLIGAKIKSVRQIMSLVIESNAKRSAPVNAAPASTAQRGR